MADTKQPAERADLARLHSWLESAKRECENTLEDYANAHPVILRALNKAEAALAKSIDLIAEAERLRGLDATLARAEWQLIETAPKDGTRILLAKIGLTHDTKGHEVNSEEWRRIVFEERPTILSVWWATVGSWRKDRWWDGYEPCGLAGPTHWMPVPPVPAGTVSFKKPQGAATSAEELPPNLRAVAVIEECNLDDDPLAARIRFLFNPVPEGEELYWSHPEPQGAASAKCGCCTDRLVYEVRYNAAGIRRCDCACHTAAGEAKP